MEVSAMCQVEEQYIFQGVWTIMNVDDVRFKGNMSKTAKMILRRNNNE